MKLITSIFLRKELPEVLTIQLIRFILTGGTTAIIDFSILYFLVEFEKINYLLAAALAFTVGSILNYFISIRWVFYRGKFNSTSIEFGLFIMFTVLGLVLNHFVMFIGHEYLGVLYTYCKIISLVIVTSFNFITKKYIVFIK